jgi:hypothetical protein
MQRLREWLRANGCKIIRQGIGPEGIELTVLADNGRVMQLVHRPGLDSFPVIANLESILSREAAPTLV